MPWGGETEVNKPYFELSLIQNISIMPITELPNVEMSESLNGAGQDN